MANELTLVAKFKNRSYFSESSPALVFSPKDFKEVFLFGIPTCTIDGRQIPDSTFEQYILSAQSLIENEFSIKLFEQQIIEERDFIREEFMSWSFVKSNYPVNSIVSLKGRFNEREIVSYPKDWLTINKTNQQKNSMRNIYIVPNGQSAVNFSYYAVTFPSLLGFLGMQKIPNYWQITYETGFKVIPEDLLQIVGITASLYLLPVLEGVVNNMGGPMFGMASQSFSLDGLSQSSSKMNGGNIFQQRLKHYQDMLSQLMPRMRMTYGGLKFEVM